MPDEKETEPQIPDMSKIEDVDSVIRVPFGIPPEGEEIVITRTGKTIQKEIRLNETFKTHYNR